MPHLYKFDKQTSARIFDRLYHDGLKVGVKDKVSAGDVEALLRRWRWMNYVR